MFNLSTLKTFFGWCSVINLCILAFTSLLLIVFKAPVLDLHSALLGLDKQDLQRLYVNYLSHFKLAVLLFNITPYFALKLTCK